MIKVQRSTERRYLRSGSQEMWMTFDQGNVEKPLQRGFRALDVLNEVKLRPGKEFHLQPDGDRESVTYVREGRLAVCHKPRKDGFLGPGYCQRANSHRMWLTGAPDESPFRGAHLFVSSLTPHRSDGESSVERKHYPFSDRRGYLRLIASPDGGGASLRVQQDVRIYSSLLDPGHHVVHEVARGRGVWLHVIEGRVQLVDQSLGTGDGVSLDDELAISFTAQEESEILLFDLA